MSPLATSIAPCETSDSLYAVRTSGAHPAAKASLRDIEAAPAHPTRPHHHAPAPPELVGRRAAGLRTGMPRATPTTPKRWALEGRARPCPDGATFWRPARTD